MGIFNFFKKKEDINKKRILRIGSISVVLPSGWILDRSNNEILALYREKKDSGVVQITVFSKKNKTKVNPKKRLKEFLNNPKIKITKKNKNNSIYIISDYYIKDKTFSKVMSVDSPEMHAFITYNIEEIFKNAYLENVDEIFDSFLFDA